MRNRDLPSTANEIDNQTANAGTVKEIYDINKGLTKLEYAAIHIAATLSLSADDDFIAQAVSRANELFDILEEI